MRPLVTALTALTWLILAAGHSAHAADGVKILWLRDWDRAKETVAAIQESTGVPIELYLYDVRAGSAEEVIIAAKRGIARDQVDLIFGLTLFDIEVLAGNRMLGEIPLRQIGVRRSRALYVAQSLRDYSRDRNFAKPDNVLAVPLTLSALMLCYDRERVGYLEDFRPSMIELAYGKLSQNLAAPDPRYDSAGRAALLSVFDAAGGVNEGWGLVEEFDRLVNEYDAASYQSCMKVSEEKAEIGITSLDVAEALERRAPRLGFQVIDGGALVPVTFVAAVSKRDSFLREGVAGVLRWVVGDGIERQIGELNDRLAKRGLQYDAWARANPKGALEFLPGEQLANEWSARYEYKSKGGFY